MSLASALALALACSWKILMLEKCANRLRHGKSTPYITDAYKLTDDCQLLYESENVNRRLEWDKRWRRSGGATTAQQPKCSVRDGKSSTIRYILFPLFMPL